MAKQKSTLKPVSTETPKQHLPVEIDDLLTITKMEVNRFANMMDGLNTFCLHVDEGNREIYNFSVAVGYIAESICKDAERIAERIGKALEGRQ